MLLYPQEKKALPPPPPPKADGDAAPDKSGKPGKTPAKAKVRDLTAALLSAPARLTMHAKTLPDAGACPLGSAPLPAPIIFASIFPQARPENVPALDPPVGQRCDQLTGELPRLLVEWARLEARVRELPAGNKARDWLKV